MRGLLWHPRSGRPRSGTFGDRRRRGTWAGDPGRGGRGRDRSRLGRAQEHAASGRLGTTEVGKVVTTTNGTWSGTTPFSYSYQWRRCDKNGGSCADISGGTDDTYTLQNADGGGSLRVVVSAKNGDGNDQATSVPTAVIAAPAANTGCPTTKSANTLAIADLSLPTRLQIVAFNVTTGPVNSQTQSFSLQKQTGTITFRLTH